MDESIDGLVGGYAGAEEDRGDDEIARDGYFCAERRTIPENDKSRPVGGS